MSKRILNKVYTETLKAIGDPNCMLVANQGGTSSGKTYSILQLLKDIALLSKKGLLITVLSHSVPHLKLGVLRDLKNICSAEGVPWNYNSTDKILSVGKSQIEMVSVDKMKAHGGRRDVLFCNEANGITWEVFKQMYIRTKLFTIIDWNPTTEFWYHEYIENNTKEYPYVFIHSTYKDNLALDPQVKFKLDNAKPGTNFYRVYVLGLTGITEGSIYTDWEEGIWDSTLPYAYGVDWGHTDPDAIVKVAVDKKKKYIYVEEIYYRVGNGTEQIIHDIEQIKNRSGGNPAFICDTASSKIISDLRRHGINIPYFSKPKIIDRVRKAQDYKIIVCGQSYNLKKELKNYIWNDKKAGVPIDKFNHLLDAFGYVFTWLTKGPAVSYGQRV